VCRQSSCIFVTAALRVTLCGLRRVVRNVEGLYQRPHITRGFSYYERDAFEWLAIVILPNGDHTRRQFFIIPRSLADAKARRDKPTSKTADERYWRSLKSPNCSPTSKAIFY
jgi:hypothetical protein